MVSKAHHLPHPTNSYRLTVTIHPSQRRAGCPVTTNLDGIEKRWPFYQQHCRTYGFGVEVEAVYQELAGSLECDNEKLGMASASCGSNGLGTGLAGPNVNLFTSHLPESADDFPADVSGGPITTLTKLIHDSSNPEGSLKRIPLQYLGEQMVIRAPHPQSQWSLHSDLIDGDIIHSIDGVVSPPFSMLNSKLHNRSKLVMEIVRSVDKVDKRDIISVPCDCEVNGSGVIDPPKEVSIPLSRSASPSFTTISIASNSLLPPNPDPPAVQPQNNTRESDMEISESSSNECHELRNQFFSDKEAELFDSVENQLEQSRNKQLNSSRDQTTSIFTKQDESDGESPPAAKDNFDVREEKLRQNPIKKHSEATTNSTIGAILTEAKGHSGILRSQSSSSSDSSSSSSDSSSSSSDSSSSSSSSSSSPSSSSSGSSDSNESDESVQSTKENVDQTQMTSNTAGSHNHHRSTAASKSRKRSVASLSARSTASAPTCISRLWPDPTDIIKALTRWQPPSAIERTNAEGERTVQFKGPVQQSNPSKSMNENPLGQSTRPTSLKYAPANFNNAAHLMEVMGDPLLNEGLASINNEYHANKFKDGIWNRDTYNLVMIKLTKVSPIFRSKSYFEDGIQLYEAQFSLDKESKIPPSFLSELYCLYSPGWHSCKLGIVAHDFPTTFTFRRNFRESNSILKLWITVSESENDLAQEVGWLSRNEFNQLLNPHRCTSLLLKDNVSLTLMSLGTTTNIVRQYEAIKSLDFINQHLQRALFTTRIPGNSKKSPSKSKPTSIPHGIWKKIKHSHNSYQLQSISNLLSGLCLENVSLIQGPPGTGKTSTIVGLVTALLSGRAPRPGQRQSGCIIHPGKAMGTAQKQPLARNRILVCAATNQAVDHLAWKIKQGSLGPSGKVGDFSMARFGSLPWENIRDSIKKPESMMSEMEKFLYETNVDCRASGGRMQDDDSSVEDCADWDKSSRRRKKQKRKRIIGHGKRRSEILSCCNIVVTTLSGAGSKAFIDAVCRDPTRNESEFDAVIIDEACQASEPESLIPFKYNPATVTLVGDPRQLPVLSLSENRSQSSVYERSLFERLQNLQWPTVMLRHQYRMHQDIASFPSEMFYKGKLITPDSVKHRTPPSWIGHPCFPTIAFWDSCGSIMEQTSKGYGFINREEAYFIMRTILLNLSHLFLCRSCEKVSIGIISFYKDQVKLLQEELSKIPALNNSRLNVKVATVDGFQGSECDIIILSCVRSQTSSACLQTTTVGFLHDYRRVNVALTRAKSSLWIVGNAGVLKQNSLWEKLIMHMCNSGVLRRSQEFRNVISNWQSSRA